MGMRLLILDVISWFSKSMMPPFENGSPKIMTDSTCAFLMLSVSSPVRKPTSLDHLAHSSLFLSLADIKMRTYLSIKLLSNSLAAPKSTRLILVLFIVIWLFGYLVIWLFGYLVIWLFGYLVIWLFVICYLLYCYLLFNLVFVCII